LPLVQRKQGDHQHDKPGHITSHADLEGHRHRCRHAVVSVEREQGQLGDGKQCAGQDGGRSGQSGQRGDGFVGHETPF
jgi:hypothetical protein